MQIHAIIRYFFISQHYGVFGNQLYKRKSKKNPKKPNQNILKQLQIKLTLHIFCSYSVPLSLPCKKQLLFRKAIMKHWIKLFWTWYIQYSVQFYMCYTPSKGMYTEVIFRKHVINYRHMTNVQITTSVNSCFPRPKMARTQLQGRSLHRLCRKDAASSCEGTSLHFALYKSALRKGQAWWHWGI